LGPSQPVKVWPPSEMEKSEIGPPHHSLDSVVITSDASRVFDRPSRMAASCTPARGAKGALPKSMPSFTAWP